MSTTEDETDLDENSLRRAIEQVEKAVRTKIEPPDEGDTREVTLDELVRVVPSALDCRAVELAMDDLAATASHPISIEWQRDERGAWRIDIADNVSPEAR